nr:hypothetical protein [Marinicella sp. W31]MDC2876516.1 hypothetical protein [Marinicella sp. W31]
MAGDEADHGALEARILGERAQMAGLNAGKSTKSAQHFGLLGKPDQNGDGELVFGGVFSGSF